MRMRHAVALLLALGLLFAGCGGDDGGGNGRSGGGTTSSGGSGSSGSSVKGAISGTGYEIALADGWSDATKNAKGSAINFDLLIGKKGGTFNTNVNILREKVGDDAGIDDLRKIYRGQLTSTGATNITASRPAEVDGDDAFTYEYDQKAPTGEMIHGRQVAVVRDGHAHTITLSASSAKFDSANEEFNEMLRSWRWK